MVALLPLPRLVFGSGALSALIGELAQLGVQRPLLLSDRGLERAGAVAVVLAAMPDTTVQHLDVPENPTAAGADAGYAAYLDGGCDGVVALGGGSVLDTAKMVAALAGTEGARAADLIGKPQLIGRAVAPLVAIPTTVGTGSESSPVSALHLDPSGPPIGTRGPMMVARVAICDPDLVRTLPPRLIAATGVDALAHCIEGYFAEPENPIVDALALDGVARAYASIAEAMKPEGDAARASLMAAAFAGGAAIHKGLGPAHAVSGAFGDQDLHHGTIVAAALPLTVAIVAPHAPVKAARLASALGLNGANDLGPALHDLIRGLGLPTSLRAAGYKPTTVEKLVDDMLASPFNRTSPYAPTRAEYMDVARTLIA